MRRPDPRAVFVLLCALLLGGCSAQVAGMQSPVLHDYGAIEWIPLTSEHRQAFISGPGNSAAIQNDATTTPQEYLARQATLPADARHGTLDRLEIGLRVADQEHGEWHTGARIELAYADEVDGLNPGGPALLDTVVDDLPRAGDRVVLDGLPELESGRVVVIRLVPGDGVDSDRLEVAITPHRAPYGGWRSVVDDEFQRGAIVFQTVYERDVALGEVVDAGIARVSDAGVVFVVLYALAMGGLAVLAMILWRRPVRRGADGR